MFLRRVLVSPRLGKSVPMAAAKDIARLNIEHYRRKLAEELDPTRRQMIVRLLAEEEAKFTQRL
jgi:hypothetical protein